MLSQNRGLKRNGRFHSGSPFQLKSFTCQEEKQSGSYAILLQTVRLSGRGKRESESEKECRRGDPHKSLAPYDPVSGFPLSGYGECGRDGSRVLPSPFTRLLQRHGHSVATRLHTALLIMPGTQSSHLMSRDPASHQVPNRSIAEVDDSSKGAAEQEEMGEEKTAWLELQRNFDKYSG